VERFRALNLDDLPLTTPGQFSRTVRDDMAAWSALIRELNLTLEWEGGMAYASRRLANRVAYPLADSQHDGRPLHRSGRRQERADRHGSPARCPRARPRRLFPLGRQRRRHGLRFAIREACAALHAKARSALPEFPEIALTRRAVPGPAGAPKVLVIVYGPPSRGARSAPCAESTAEAE